MAEVSLANLKYGANNADVKDFQNALKAHGHSPGPVDGVYGAQTKAACKAFQKAQGWSGDDADGLPGAGTCKLLALTVVSDGEPAHNYARTTYGSKTVNQRTKVMLNTAAGYFGSPLYLVQGSYNKGVAASAGTHDGGGCVDVGVAGWSTATRNSAVKALRRAGFAAWLRTPAEGFQYHIHACAIGDREMASVARSQVRDYFNGRSGLATGTRDTAPASVGRPWPAWANKYR
ncbi:peptidoglycan-binding domain-containing protein [Streptomyces sp. NPDC055085]